MIFAGSGQAVNSFCAVPFPWWMPLRVFRQLKPDLGQGLQSLS